MHVDMERIEALVSRTRDAHDRVQVGSVAIRVCPHRVDRLGDLEYLRVEQPEGVGIGEHEGGDLRVERRLERIDVDEPTLVARYGDRIVAAHRYRCGVGSMRGVGDDDLTARITGCDMGGLETHQCGQLAMRTCRRLEGDRWQPGDLAERLLQSDHEFECALHGVEGLVRMESRETLQTRCVLVDPRVVLHRTTPERVRSRVDPEVHLGKMSVVTHDLDLGDVWQARRRGAHHAGDDPGKVHTRHVEGRAEDAGRLG